LDWATWVEVFIWFTGEDMTVVDRKDIEVVAEEKNV
jgi:hypothetical protein